MFMRFIAGPLFAAVCASGAGDAVAQRRMLEMPASLQRHPQPPADITPSGDVPSAPAVPPGLSRMLSSPAERQDPTPIATSGATPPPPRPSTVDIYNNLTRGTLDQIRQGQYPTGNPGDRLIGENRWAMPPAVGVVIQRPVGVANLNGSTPATIGLNAGPSVDAYGTPGMTVNARLRMPFGR